MMRAIILDADKVVMNFSEQQALSWREGLRHFCQYVPIETIRRQISEHGYESMRTFFTNTRLGDYGQTFITHVRQIFKEKYQARVQIRAQMYELMAELLGSDIAIGLISTDAPETLQKEKQLAHIEMLLQTKTRFAQDDSNQAIVNALNDLLTQMDILDASEVTVICATPTLARIARAMNMQVIGLTLNSFGTAELQTAGCDKVINDLNDILPFIRAAKGPYAVFKQNRSHLPKENVATLKQMHPLIIKT